MIRKVPVIAFIIVFFLLSMSIASAFGMGNVDGVWASPAITSCTGLSWRL